MDVADVFTGRRSARWVMQFVERCYRHPDAVTRARILGGDKGWHEWYGWTVAATKVAELSDLFIAANSDPNSKPQRVWIPTLVRAAVEQPQDLDDSYNQLMRMAGQ